MLIFRQCVIRVSNLAHLQTKHRYYQNGYLRLWRRTSSLPPKTYWLLTTPALPPLSFPCTQSKYDSSTNASHTFGQGCMDALCRCNVHKLWWKPVWCHTNCDGFCSSERWAAITHFFWLVKKSWCGWASLVRLPKAMHDEELGQTICYREPKIPLTINSLPLSMSFGIFDSYVAVPFILWYHLLKSSGGIGHTFLQTQLHSRNRYWTVQLQ